MTYGFCRLSFGLSTILTKGTEMNIYTLIGRRVFEERKRAGLTIEELAEAASISPSFLAYIEHGKKKASVLTISQLAEGLSIPVGKLFDSAPRGRSRVESGIVAKLNAMLNRKSETDHKMIFE